MPSLTQLTALDWTVIGRNALNAATAALAEAAQTRAQAAPGTIRAVTQSDDRATISVEDAALIRREQGQLSASPKPFLAPTKRDLQAAHDAAANSLAKDSR